MTLGDIIGRAEQRVSSHGLNQVEYARIVATQIRLELEAEGYTDIVIQGLLVNMVDHTGPSLLGLALLESFGYRATWTPDYKVASITPAD